MAPVPAIPATGRVFTDVLNSLQNLGIQIRRLKPAATMSDSLKSEILKAPCGKSSGFPLFSYEVNKT